MRAGRLVAACCWSCTLVAATVVVAATAAAASTADADPPLCAATASSLKVERRGQQGFAVATARPRFSWMLDAVYGSATNITQDSYQVQVLKTATPQSAADVLWDTGRVASAATLEIEYAGPALVSEQRVWWRVQAWTVGGGGSSSGSGGLSDSPAACDGGPVSTGWSPASFFRVGRLNATADWTGVWIAQPGAQVPNPTNSCAFYDDRPNSLFRTTFTVPAASAAESPRAGAKGGREGGEEEEGEGEAEAGSGGSGAPLVEAVLHITGLGYYAAYINGHRVGASALDPGFTSYDKRVLYSTYDVTALLLPPGSNDTASSNNNVLAVALGNGWWNPLPLLFWGHLNLRDALAVGTRPMLRLDLVAAYADGTTALLASSAPGTAGRWVTAGGPLLRNDVYLGVKYDARVDAARAGWTGGGAPGAPAFNDSSWVPAEAEAEGSALVGPLEPETVEAVEATETLAGSLIHSSDANQVWDLGRNFAGGVTITFVGPLSAGDGVTITYGEILQPNGSAVNPLTSTAGQIKGGSGGPCAPAFGFQQDRVVFRDVPAGERLVFQTEFTWHAFRYLEITPGTGAAPAERGATHKLNDDDGDDGDDDNNSNNHAHHAPAPSAPSSVLRRSSSSPPPPPPAFSMPAVADVSGAPLRSHVAVASTFHADAATAPRFDAIWDMCLNTHAANMMSIQSDCPHRERFGYTGDLLASAETALLGFDVSNFYAKRARDVVDAQRAAGGVTETAPFVGIADAGLGNESGPIGWDSVLLPLQLYLFDYYGDARTLADSYAASARWVEFLLAAPGAAVEGGLSDWMATEHTPPALTGRAFLWLNLWSWARVNAVLGHADVAANFTRQAAAAAAALDAEFLDPTTGAYAKAGQFNGSQCGQSMPLFYGITDPTHAASALQVLLDNIHGPVSNGTLQTGMFCIKYCLEALSRAGHVDEAFAMINTTAMPSYGYMIEHGATTIWESWFESNNTFSHNHPMFSSVAVWMVKSLAGVRQADDGFPTAAQQPLPQHRHHQQLDVSLPCSVSSTTTAATATGSEGAVALQGNAFSHLRLQPLLPKGLGGVNYTFDSPRGRVESNWTVASATDTPTGRGGGEGAAREAGGGGVFEWAVRLPVNVHADVVLPNTTVAFTVGSGVHRFTVQLP